MNKICTNINQSKKLIDLGVDRKTSDMYYWCGGSLRIGGYKAQEEDLDIPAWSLSALLELMPTDDKKDEYYVDTESHSNYYTVSYRNCWDGCIHSEYSEESLLDAAFEMIILLKENGKL